MFLTDRVSVSATRRTADGYLVADAKVARTGIQTYLGSEVGRPDMPTVRVYRPPEEVFAADAMHSYAYRPVTVEHPPAMVTADTWKEVSAGQTGGEVVRDGEFVRVPLVLMDADAIKAYEAGKRELSMGYSAEIVFGDGVTPDGEPYDAVQRNLRMNHLAVVSKARGGEQLRIGDGRAPDDRARGANNPQTEKSTMSNTNTRTVMVDGLSVETTDAGAQAIAKLQQQVKDSATALSDAQAKHQAELADRDAQLAKAEAERDAAQARVLSDADLDAKVQKRADLISTAKAIADSDYTGKSDADIRKAAVVAKLGDAAVKDKSDAYIEARFDILAEDAKADPVNKALRDGATRQPVKDNGYAASIADFDRTKKEGLIMAVQTDYKTNLAPAIAGAQATMVPATIISRNVEGAPIGFGVGVSQGAGDKGIVAGGAAFVGITLLDRSASGENDTFRVGDSARVMTKGDVWVVASGAVSAGDGVAMSAAGAFSAAGEDDDAIPGARWDTSATNGQLAVIRLG